MLLSSEILSAFLALLLAAVLGAWIVALGLWQLSGALFLLPICAGAMLATWLRIPDWIAGRTAWRHWLRPAAALATSAILVAIMLPIVRLHQIDGLRTVLSTNTPGHETTAVNSFAFQQYNTAATDTAALYWKALTLFNAPIENSPLEPWSGPEYTSRPGIALEGSPLGAIDENKIPKDQFVAFLAAKRELENRIQKQREQALDLVIEASKRPTCHFDSFLSSDDLLPANQRITSPLQVAPPPTPSNSPHLTAKSYYQIEGVQNTLIIPELMGPQEPLNVPFERLIAALRMSTHIMSGQPTLIVRQQFHQQQLIFRFICGWAHHNESDPEKLSDAFHQLEQFHVWRFPTENFMAEGRLIRKVLIGKDLPTSFSQKQVPQNAKMAYVVNDLPWERQRALNANESVLTHNANDATLLVNFVRTAKPNQLDLNIMQKLRPDYEADSLSAEYPQAATSYLFAQEYRARVAMKELLCDFCDAEACRRAAMIEIALLQFRHDHHKYPATLSELQPFPETLRLDPYTSQSFFYMPNGLEQNLTRYCGAPVDIRAQTPILWSVGRNNVQLKNQDFTEQVQPDSQIVPQHDRETEPYYVLEPSQGSYGPATASLVFEFPRLVSSQSNGATEPNPGSE